MSLLKLPCGTYVLTEGIISLNMSIHEQYNSITCREELCEFLNITYITGTALCIETKNFETEENYDNCTKDINFLILNMEYNDYV